MEQRLSHRTVGSTDVSDSSNGKRLSLRGWIVGSQRHRDISYIYIYIERERHTTIETLCQFANSEAGCLEQTPSHRPLLGPPGAGHPRCSPMIIVSGASQGRLDLSELMDLIWEPQPFCAMEQHCANRHWLCSGCAVLDTCKSR